VTRVVDPRTCEPVLVERTFSVVEDDTQHVELLDRDDA
jgi:hypothetical protein